MPPFGLSAFRALSVSTLALVATTGLVSATASAMQSANCQAGANHVNQFTSTANIFTAFGNAASEPAEGCPLCGVLVTVDPRLVPDPEAVLARLARALTLVPGEPR